MTIFTVHLPRAAQEPAQVAEGLRVVPEAFSLAAFCFGPLWLIRHGAWLAAAAWLVVTLALLTGLLQFGLSGEGIGLILLVVELFLGVEGHQIVRRRLSRGAFRMADVIAANSRDEAEEAFLRRWASADPVPPSMPLPPGPVGLPSLGLFADSGRPA